MAAARGGARQGLGDDPVEWALARLDAGLLRYASEDGVIECSSAGHVRRPKLDYGSHAVGLVRNELAPISSGPGWPDPPGSLHPIAEQPEALLLTLTALLRSTVFSERKHCQHTRSNCKCDEDDAKAG
jgi:hypothetical protein